VAANVVTVVVGVAVDWRPVVGMRSGSMRVLARPWRCVWVTLVWPTQRGMGPIRNYGVRDGVIRRRAVLKGLRGYDF